MDMKPWNKLRECAKSVVAESKAAGRNRLYLMAYWGKGMRGHMAYIKAEGLEANVKPEVARAVAKAEAVLVAECDGKDCSFLR